MTNIYLGSTAGRRAWLHERVGDDDEVVLNEDEPAVLRDWDRLQQLARFVVVDLKLLRAGCIEQVIDDLDGAVGPLQLDGGLVVAVQLPVPGQLALQAPPALLVVPQPAPVPGVPLLANLKKEGKSGALRSNPTKMGGTRG